MSKVTTTSGRPLIITEIVLPSMTLVTRAGTRLRVGSGLSGGDSPPLLTRTTRIAGRTSPSVAMMSIQRPT